MKRISIIKSNILILIMAMTTITSCTSSKKIFQIKELEEFAAQLIKPESILSKQEAAHLPACVQNT